MSFLPHDHRKATGWPARARAKHLGRKGVEVAAPELALDRHEQAGKQEHNHPEHQDDQRPDTRGKGSLALADGGCQASFDLVVRRHGAMVAGVCRRLIGCGYDAEDAAQAVFIELAARARDLSGRRSVAGWLHRTA